MEACIIRICRRNPRDRGDVSGTVEFLGDWRIRTFLDMETLVDILRSGPEGRAVSARMRRRAHRAERRESPYVNLLRAIKEGRLEDEGPETVPPRTWPVDGMKRRDRADKRETPPS